MNQPLDLNTLLNMISQQVRSTLVWTLRDAEVMCYAEATRDTAAYITENMLTAKLFRGDKIPQNRGRFEVLEHALGNLEIEDGLVLEFGVHKGDTLKFIADRIDTYAYGFDSFEGLPENWFFEHDKAEFNLGGQLPEIATHRGNIRLVKGWFDDTLPNFCKEAKGKPIKFLHIDCDIYSSTKTIFDNLAPNIIPGTVIVFDEYYNYPGWREHEFKAFQEYVSAHKVKYEYVSYAPRHYSLAIKILSVG
jgi:hypothetical protein